MRVTETPGVALADADYWKHEHMDNLAADGIAVLIRPDSRNAGAPGPDGKAGATRGCAKHNRGRGRFRRRGRSAVGTEWRLVATTHKVVKLQKHTVALAAP